MKVYDDLKKFQTKTNSQSVVFKEFSHRRTHKSFEYLFGKEKRDTLEDPEFPNSKSTPSGMICENNISNKSKGVYKSERKMIHSLYQTMKKNKKS